MPIRQLLDSNAFNPERDPARLRQAALQALSLALEHPETPPI